MAGCKGRFVEPDFNSGSQVLYWPTNQVFRGLPALRTLETSSTNLLHCVEEMLHSMGTEVFEGTVQVSSTLHVFLRAKDQKDIKDPEIYSNMASSCTNCLLVCGPGKIDVTRIKLDCWSAASTCFDFFRLFDTITIYIYITIFKIIWVHLNIFKSTWTSEDSQVFQYLPRLCTRGCVCELPTPTLLKLSKFHGAAAGVGAFAPPHYDAQRRM